PSNVKASKTEAVISVRSINTEEKKRDEHLLNEDFFEVEKFPEIVFKSKEIKNIKADSFDVLGDLSIRGVTKPVTLNVSVGGVVKDPWGKERAGFSATTKINRRDFGLTWSKLMETGGLVVDDEVFITLDIEGVKEG
ncbi:MAG: YceI family protein, partial [SAR324 cluster bacterium]|nr:YceI family protein [SAR324 cluster bacterium]